MTSLCEITNPEEKFGRKQPRKPRHVGGAKGENMDETSFPGSLALWAESFIKRIRLWFIRRGLRFIMLVYSVLLQVAKWVGPRKRQVGNEGYDILLTGTFYSDNWVMAHLHPLAMSEHCAHVWVVATSIIPKIDKVEAIYPPSWLVSILGTVPARLLTFIWVGLRKRPHVIGGFHLLLNGLVAALLARLTGSRSLYFCVGSGPTEVLHTGKTENRLFKKLGGSDQVIEKRLLQAVSSFDIVITMGSNAIKFFRQQGVDTRFHIVSGGIDTNLFYPSESPPTIDIISVGRLVPVKRLDLFLKAVRIIKDSIPGVTAILVGDGPLLGSLKALAKELGVDKNVSFIGHQNNVEDWLRKAKVFVLTSDSEGLSLSMMEAMMCGLPVVVSHVGDLGDLVEDGVNGHLVSERTPEKFAMYIIDCLKSKDRLSLYSKQGRKAAVRYEIRAASRLWTQVLPPQWTHQKPERSG
jgi:glycosyltransferase involved in cell wall biosynthesis